MLGSGKGGRGGGRAWGLGMRFCLGSWGCEGRRGGWEGGRVVFCRGTGGLLSFSLLEKLLFFVLSLSRLYPICYYSSSVLSLSYLFLPISSSSDN